MKNVDLIKPKSVLVSTILFFCCVVSTDVHAQGTSTTPILPNVPFDYVEHAVTNLPEQYLPQAPFGDAGAAINTPADNPITNDGATLGRVLFYDRRLSLNNSISCASCHTQETGFGDTRQLSVGHTGLQTQRHSMALTNAVFYFSGRFRWDESAETLEVQCLIPIEAPSEMGLPLSLLRERLANTPFYENLFVRAFGDSNVTDERIAKSLAQFVRSLVSYDSKYDQAFAVGESGFPDFPAVFNESELLGQSLFERTDNSIECHECHVSPAQIGQEPRNIGLDLKTIDEGAGMGRFKVPSLRNVEVRGRFMHDGRFSSLEEVVEFYNSGIQMHPNLDDLLLNNLKLNLTDEEKQGLVDFMKTLTDHEFLNSPLFSDPFQLPLLGDVNRDGTVDHFDVGLFVERIVNGIFQAEADVNDDGVVDLFDVQPFVKLLSK